MNLAAPAFLLISFVLTVSLDAFGQTRLFGKYRFEDGGYTLVGMRSESDKNKLADSLGDFYTEDIDLLNAIKRTWVFRRPQHRHACGYHYYVVLLKDGKRIQSHSINLSCHELTTENGSLYFDSRLLSKFSSRLQKLRKSQDTFATTVEARKFWAKIHTEKSFVYADEPDWLKFEGSFGFTYKCPSPGCDNFLDRDKFTEPVRAMIAQRYPGEEFSIRPNGGTSNNEIFFDIQSSESFYKGFNLFPLDPKSYFNGLWKPHHLFLTTYWK